MGDNQKYRVDDSVSRIIVDPKSYADGRIFEAYARLRSNNPVAWVDAEGFNSFWLISRYDDVQSISMNDKLFPYGDRPSIFMDAGSEAWLRKVTGKPYAVSSLVTTDNPYHNKLRLITQAWFSPKNLKMLEEDVGRVAEAAVENMQALGPDIDFVSEVALYYPLKIIMKILGVPDADLPFMLRLTQESFAPADPDSIPEGLDSNDPNFFGKALKNVMDQMQSYFEEITQERRANPKNDIATVLANATVDGERLPAIERLGYYAIIATAGHDTTSSSTSAVMHALATCPNLLERVKSDLSLVPALIEEAVRWGTPVKTFMRSVAEDTELRGRQLKKGDWVMLCYASANRDSEALEFPEKFNTDRRDNKHLAFGKGTHVCLGQHLARMEMKILFEKLLPRIRRISLSGEPKFTSSFFVNGLKKLPLNIEYG